MPSSWELPSAGDAQSAAGKPDLSVERRRAVDVRVFHTEDGGEIAITNGSVEMADGLFNAFYYSILGGNEEDDGSESTKTRQWWGNHSEVRPARQLRSKTQALLRSLPAVPGNLRKIEDAIAIDTAWMVDERVVSSISALATIPSRDALKIEVSAQVSDAVYKFDVSAPWGQAA